MDKKKDRLKSAVNLLKLLSHPVRLSILCNLLHKGEMSVTQIIEEEKGLAGQSQISQFLSKMRKEGLVITRKEAQTVYYRIDSPYAKLVVQALYEIYCGGPHSTQTAKREEQTKPDWSPDCGQD